MKIWVLARECVEEATAEAIRAALSEAGMQAVKPPAWPAPGDGVVVYADASEQLVKSLRDLCRWSNGRVVAVGIGSVRQAVWELLEAGAADVLSWQGRETAEEIRARFQRWARVAREVDSPLVSENMVGQSAAWQRALRQLVESALFCQDPVLLSGESGTGKELAARLLHALDSRRCRRELVVVDCTTLNKELAGSELFGHERGAYTGAVAARAGAFELADEGTLFLDEAGELSLPLQAQLLRVIQEKTYKRVGGNQWRKANFRLVAATNRDLRAMVEAGRFRSDLYYRLASIPVTLPPLRERTEDIIPLARHFARLLRAPGDPTPVLDPALEAYLQTREYPGNVRDLRQLVARIMHRHGGAAVLSPGMLPEGERPLASAGGTAWPDEPFTQSVRRAIANGFGLQAVAREAKEAALGAALDLEAGSVRRAAERLGVTERALQLRRAKAAVSSLP
jgi:transcriptional regulator with GAF, ATPase, and Fis domain